MDIRDSLRSHHSRYGILYGPQDFSDHGPMATLALLGLGAEARMADAYLRHYRQRLRPLTQAPANYRHWLDVYLKQVATQGADTVLAAVLPGLISGWAKHAYHPLIRLAYGWEFELEEEVAAGLAYLHYCGPDPRLEALASAATRTDAAPADLFHAIAPLAIRHAPSFDDGLNQVLQNPAVNQYAVVLDDNIHRMTRTALDVFAATHDFFALHLVTSAYAFRLLQPLAGLRADALFNLGLLVGYAAIGAPDFEPKHYPRAADNRDASADWLSLAGQDEHSIKLAYSASRLADLQQDDAFTLAAVEYLTRPPATGS